jgi:hypothetical protein
VISDRVNPNKFYGFAAGKVYVSTNGGASFTASAANGLPVEGNADLDAVPGTEGELWFAGGSEEGGPYGLWHSTDSGATFTKLANVEEADSIGFGKAAPGQNVVALYTIAKIDGTRGFFRSDDGGANWVRINDNQHQYARVTTITGDPRLYGRVYLGTNGRGILYADRIGGNNGGGEGGGGSPVISSAITPVNAEFDKNPGNQADIPVTLTLNGNTLSTIRNGSSTLVSGADYTLSGNQVVLSKTYLASLPKGSAALTFHFSAGNDAILNLTIQDTTVVPAGAIRIGMFNGTTSATSNSVNPKIKLTNTGTTAINLSDVKIRYYYTINGAQTQSFFCDWATAGNDNVTGTFSALSTPVTGADYMLEIGFKASAGSLAAGQSTEIQARFSKSDWSNYTQTDDYSFAPSQTAYTDWSKVTGYIGGSLQWGIEP